jgi:Winged helix-turn helix
MFGRAKNILAADEVCGTAEIVRRSGKAKPVVWRWQARFMAEGVAGLTRDKTRKPASHRSLWPPCGGSKPA